MRSDEELVKTIAVELRGSTVYYTMLEPMMDEAESTRQAELAARQIKEYFAAHPAKPMSALVNLLPLGNATYLSDGAKKIYIDLMQLPQLSHLAFVVESKLIRMITSLMTQLSARWGKIKWFSSVDEAEAWLRSDTKST